MVRKQKRFIDPYKMEMVVEEKKILPYQRKEEKKLLQFK
jgi:hypothetical protein